MEQSRTVVEAKLAFLRQQIRLLSAQLQPSAQWHDDVAQIDEPDLGDKVVEEAMNKRMVPSFQVCRQSPN